MYIEVNNNIISRNAELYTGFKKFIGLMFSRKLKDDEALILNNSSDIHMMFVFQKIDVVWLNKGKIVIGKRENVKPFEFLIRPEKTAFYVLELPVGKAKLFKLKSRVNFG
ncbi:DUF192 domain-containing protein [Candidatus Woesearchaeota archaeon]|nr:DUF192 domain-containing protein [Candidatus Woesearchaeota archaeon]